MVPADPGAAGPAQIRVSDAERERALAELKTGFAAGRLTQDTFVYRIDQVLRARVSDDLRALVADLPRPWRFRAAAATACRRTATACRRTARAARRWLGGWPPALTLPPGSQPRFTIGRELACDMTLADETVSRWHATLERGPAGDWLLADLGSMNGTRLNGWRVRGPMPVRAGDLVSFGALTFVLTERP